MNIESLTIDELLECFKDSMVARGMDDGLKFKNAADERELKYQDLYTRLADINERVNDSSESRLFDLLELQSDFFNNEIQLKDEYIYLLERHIEAINITWPLAELAEDMNAKVIVAQETILDKYQKGTQKRSLLSKQKWVLANEYFKEEILAHRTLKAARLAAAKKAGIVVEERRLIQKMPNPK